MRLTVEVEREREGRWIAEVMEVPGAMVYGATRQKAIAKARALARRVLADREEEAGLARILRRTKRRDAGGPGTSLAEMKRLLGMAGRKTKPARHE